MLTSKGSTSSNIDIEYHLQVATRAFDANKTVLCDKHMSICRRLCYFHTLVMPAACFGAGPRAIHAVSKIDVHPRKLVRNIVGPRPQTNWDSRWHIILHVLTGKKKIFCSTIRCSYVDNIVLATTLAFSRYIVNLPPTDGLQRFYIGYQWAMQQWEGRAVHGNRNLKDFSATN
jgi:hypothetical protein